ncbi:MAG: hypothetical protein HQK99_06955 [Nitrospirae bacterium]|nr:hypothetical protein [Nitrospirota bacterium]
MSETITEAALPVAAGTTAAVTNPDIERINGILQVLSPERVKEIADFTAFLAEKERKHKAFVDETLAAEASTERYTFKNSNELIQAAIDSVSDDA